MKITIDNTEEQIDWDKQNILITKDNKNIVLTNGVHTNTLFEAIPFQYGNYVSNFNFDNRWVKKLFKLFKGTISN